MARDVVHVQAPGSDGNSKEGRQGYSDNDSHDNRIAVNDRISVTMEESLRGSGVKG